MTLKNKGLKVVFVIFTIFIFGYLYSYKSISTQNKDEIIWSKFDSFSSFDIKYIQLNFNPFVDTSISGKSIEYFLTKKTNYILDSEDIKRLFEIVSDSGSFYGECGTFALNAGFIFMRNDSVKATIEMGCGYTQWNLEPEYEKRLGGSLSENGFKKMEIMLDEINKKMSKK